MIFLDGLECDGTETLLLDCTTDVELGLSLCGHSDDVGIRCYGEVFFGMLFYQLHIITIVNDN